MDAALAGILGASIGGITGIAGGLLTHALKSKTDREEWVRDKRVEAYSSVIRYLVRLSNKRSQITAEGVTVLGTDAMKEWFDEIDDVLAWMTSLSIYCSEAERSYVLKGSKLLNEAAAGFIQSGSGPANLIKTAHEVCISIADSARRDIGASIN